ncbi:hypothetical protein [Streptomyces aureus]|uniref:hypothetical protein n=1 Tax=Streptomyces aureus TaxID=193461 RepID=UPI00055E0E02|nr:hypothetical protein [Streptomyces aureus]
MLLTALVLAALTPGVVTGWRVYRRRGWPRAILAGAGVTVGVAGLALLSLIMSAPLASVLAALSAVAALNAYDRGRLLLATLWVTTMAVCIWCAGWAR